jgi:DNA-binding SARP family transcriptional activator/WD40 repeat protein
MLEYRALGALAVVMDGALADIGGPRQRRLLAMLLAHRGTVVTTDRLVGAVFAGEPSPRAAATLRSYVTRLRRTIGPTGTDALQRVGRGYRLEVSDDGFDVARFEKLADRGRRELRYGDAASAVATLRHALGLWRGSAYEEFADEPWLEPEARRLDELRQVATEHLVDAELECGRATEMVVELERLIEDEPLRDAYRSRLMLALYRSGRPVDALQVFQTYRRVLADELGMDPTPELTDLERRILAHDPSLRLPAPAGRPLRGYRLGERLGRGRLGTVHAARLAGVPRDYAIRLYPAEIADDPTFVRSFEPDARRLASVDHPAVVEVHDAWREPGAAALVMRRMTGGTLRDRLADGPLSRAEASAVFERIGGALVAAARRGLTHGNLRPGSVLFDADGAAHLGDFALGSDRHAHHADAASFHALVGECCEATTPAPVAGASPEVVVETVLAQLRGKPVRVTADNPYVGLRPFDEPDADRFFGRDALVDTLLARVEADDANHRLVLVVGGSGSGKSSVVRAGLVPRLRRGVAGGSWTVATMLPGSAPFKELVEALRGVAIGQLPGLVDELRGDPQALAAVAERIIPADGRMVLVVDQLDELFSLAPPADRDPFLDALAHAVSVPGGRLSVVATLRADYFDRPLDHARFAAVVHGATVTVPAMTAAELGRAVTGPATDLEIDPGLAAELVASVVDQPAALPALQFTLYELAERGNGRLTRADLAALGGIDGAIATRAEQLHAALDEERHQVVRRLFERLFAIEPTGEAARRRAPRSEIVRLGDDAVVDRVAETWVQARLLTSDRDPETREPTLEVAHEAVLQRWPRLLRWIDEDRDWLRTLAQLQQSAATWRDLDRDAGALLRGARLERALDATAGRDDTLPDAVRSLLDASVEARDAEAAREAEAAAAQERAHRRLRTQRVLLAAALAIAIVVGAFAVERQVAASRAAAEASRNAAAADARAQAATTGLVAASDEALRSDWRLALLLAVEAYRLDDSPATRRGLLTALTNPRPIPTAVHANPVGFQAVAVDEARGLVVAKEPLGPIHVIDRDRGETIGRPLPAPALFRVGGLDLHDRLIAAGGLETDGTTAVVYDLDSGAEVAALPGRASEMAEVAFSPDGRSLAVTGVGRVRIFDVDTWTRTATLVTGDDEQLMSVAWHGDGSRLYAGGFEGTLLTWDLDRPAVRGGTKQPSRRVALAVEPEPTPVTTIEPIGDLDMLAVAPFDPALYLVDADTLRVVEGPLLHDNFTFGLAVDTERDRIAVPAVNRVALWSLRPFRTPDGDVGLEEPPTREDTLIASGSDAWFDADGGLLTVGLDGDVTSWDLDPPSPAFEPIPDAGFGIPTFSPDGDVLAVWGGGGGVRLLDAETYEVRARMDIPRPEDASIGGVAFEPGGEHIAAVWCPAVDPRAQQPCRGRLAVFDEASGRAVAGPVELDPIPDWTATISVSADGELIAVGHDGGRVDVREMATLDVVHRLDDLVRGGENFVIDTSFSPIHARLLTVSTADDAAVWDLSEDEPTLVVKGRTGLTNRFTPDGRIVSSDQDGSLELRNPTTLDVVAGIEGLEGPVIAPSFTADGRLMVTTDDLTAAVRLWRLDDLEQFGGPIDGVVGGTIHPDGSALVVGGDPALHLPMDPDAWVRAACETAGRNLTTQEWERYFADEPYRRTCP